MRIHRLLPLLLASVICSPADAAPRVTGSLSVNMPVVSYYSNQFILTYTVTGLKPHEYANVGVECDWEGGGHYAGDPFTDTRFWWALSETQMRWYPWAADIETTRTPTADCDAYLWHVSSKGVVTELAEAEFTETYP